MLIISDEWMNIDCANDIVLIAHFVPICFCWQSSFGSQAATFHLYVSNRLAVNDYCFVARPRISASCDFICELLQRFWLRAAACVCPRIPFKKFKKLVFKASVRGVGGGREHLRRCRRSFPHAQIRCVCGQKLFEFKFRLPKELNETKQKKKKSKSNANANANSNSQIQIQI